MKTAFGLILFVLAGCSTISKGKMGPDYKVLAVSHVDSTGLYWLEKLDEPLSNGCVNKDDVFHANLCTTTIESAFDSRAEEQCEIFGARLPTLQEYERLLKDDQGDLAKGLSNQTYRDIARDFKDEMLYAAWTSSVNPRDHTQASYFSWRKGNVGQRFEFRSVALPIRCVRRP